jgi:dinuclear metal center YbgI/SA1388 family protein
MALVSEILDHLDGLLDASGWDDYGPNGLQVPGRAEVDRVVTGVSAGRELFERAVSLGAGLVLVHHGLFWDRQPRALSPANAARLRVLLEADVNLAAYHLPLDAHAEIGNNALIADALGCDERRPFAEHRGRPVGVAARFGGQGVPAAELWERVRRTTGREPLVFDAGPDRVRSIGIVSGGAAGDLEAAVAAGLDAFLTGEPEEFVMNQAREAGLHFVAAGHYATETFGIRRLGDLVSQRFGIDHDWVDLPNPI